MSASPLTVTSAQECNHHISLHAGTLLASFEGENTPKDPPPPEQVFLSALSVVTSVVLKSVMKREYNLSAEQCATFNPRDIRQERIGRSMAMSPLLVRRPWDHRPAPWDHRRTAFAQEEGAGTNPVRNRFPAAEWLEKVMPLVKNFSNSPEIAAYIRELTDADPWDDSRARHEHKLSALEGRRTRGSRAAAGAAQAATPSRAGRKPKTKMEPKKKGRRRGYESDEDSDYEAPNRKRPRARAREAAPAADEVGRVFWRTYLGCTRRAGFGATPAWPGSTMDSQAQDIASALTGAVDSALRSSASGLETQLRRRAEDAADGKEANRACYRLLTHLQERHQARAQKFESFALTYLLRAPEGPAVPAELRGAGALAKTENDEITGRLEVRAKESQALEQETMGRWRDGLRPTWAMASKLYSAWFSLQEISKVQAQLVQSVRKSHALHQEAAQLKQRWSLLQAAEEAAGKGGLRHVAKELREVVQQVGQLTGKEHLPYADLQHQASPQKRRNFLEDLEVTDLPSERWTALSGKPSPSTASGSSTSRFTSEELSTTSSETQRDFRSQPFFEDPWHGYHELIEEDWQAWTEDFRRRQQAYSGACPPRDGPRPPTSSALVWASVRSSKVCFGSHQERMHDASNQQVVVSESRMSFDSWDSTAAARRLLGATDFTRLMSGRPLRRRLWPLVSPLLLCCLSQVAGPSFIGLPSRVSAREGLARHAAEKGFGAAKEDGKKKKSKGGEEQTKEGETSIVKDKKSSKSKALSKQRLSDLRDKTLAEELDEYEMGKAMIAKYGREVSVMPPNVAERVAKRGMVIGGSFYATMLAVFAFGIALFKTQDTESQPWLGQWGGDCNSSHFDGLCDFGTFGFGHLWGVLWYDFGDNMKILGEGFRRATLQTEYEKALDMRNERRKLLEAKEKKKQELLNK
eukprot:g33231.t1